MAIFAGRVSSRAARTVLSAVALTLGFQFGFGAYVEHNPKRKDPTYGDKFDKLAARQVNCLG